MATNEADRPPPLKVGDREVKLSRCKCGEPVLHARTSNDRPIALDPEPNITGVYSCRLTPEGKVVATRTGWTAGVFKRSCHWDWCPLKKKEET